MSYMDKLDEMSVDELNELAKKLAKVKANLNINTSHIHEQDFNNKWYNQILPFLATVGNLAAQIIPLIPCQIL
jgi:hypothetical protein